MPKELFEITMFNAGTICNPSQTDVPSEAASNSINIDPTTEDGKLKGIPDKVKLEDSTGHEVNVLLNNGTTEDLIAYKDSNNTVYKSENVYGGSSTETSLGTLVSATDEISMQSAEGAVYLGAGNGITDSPPQWIGRLDHGQWGAVASNALVMQEDTLLPPNIYNEASTGCSDGINLFISQTGLDGNNGGDTLENNQNASGEITKIRLSDGKVLKRSKHVLNYVNAICLSEDNAHIFVIGSKAFPVATITGATSSNTHTIYKFSANDLSYITEYTTNLDTLIRSDDLVSTASGRWEAFTATNWEAEDSYWDITWDYQGAFSDIMCLNNDIWVCTFAGFVANVDIPTAEGNLDFTNRTPYGLGFGYNGATKTNEYEGPLADSTDFDGRWVNASGKNQFPDWANCSLVQLTGSNQYIGLHIKNTNISDAINFRQDSADVANVVGRTCLIIVRDTHGANERITGNADSTAYFNILNDTAIADSNKGTRRTLVTRFKPPKDTYLEAYNLVKQRYSSNNRNRIGYFTPPAYNADKTTISVTELSAESHNLIPLRTSATVIYGIVSDAYLSNPHMTATDYNTAAERNPYRFINKWTDDGGWTKEQIGSSVMMSNIAFRIEHSETDSGFHVAGTGYSYRFSIIYDGFQESPLGAAQHIISTGKEVNINMLYNTDNFPTRATAIRIYRASSISSVNKSIGGFYHFISEIDVTENPAEALNTNYYSEYYTGDLTITKKVTQVDHGPVGASYETMSGLFEEMTDSNIKYALSTNINSSLFIAKCNHHSQDNAKNIIYKSLPFKPSVVNWALDFVQLPYTPTAIKAFSGRIYAFTANKTIKIDPNQLFIEDEFEGAGCLSPESISVSDFGMCYCDNNNIYHHLGSGMPIPIGDSILRSDDSIGYLDLLNSGSFMPKIGFDSRRKCFVVIVSASKAWAYNVVRKRWDLWDAPEVNAILQGKDGEILAPVTADNHLYKLYNDAAARLTWSWTSKRLSMRHKTQNKRWYEAIAAYSGTAPTFTIYWDYGAGAASIASGTAESNIIRKQLGDTETAVNHKLIKAKLTAGGADTEVDSIGFTFRRFVKLIDQGAPS